MRRLMEFISLQLKEMQDEILTKNGEIKVLRDSMQQMKHTMEEQRRSYALLEQQQSQALGEKEREFSKKVCSCQSPPHHTQKEAHCVTSVLPRSVRSKEEYLCDASECAFILLCGRKPLQEPDRALLLPKEERS